MVLTRFCHMSPTAHLRPACGQSNAMVDQGTPSEISWNASKYHEISSNHLNTDMKIFGNPLYIILNFEQFPRTHPSWVGCSSLALQVACHHSSPVRRWIPCSFASWDYLQRTGGKDPPAEGQQHQQLLWARENPFNSGQEYQKPCNFKPNMTPA